MNNKVLSAIAAVAMIGSFPLYCLAQTMAAVPAPDAAKQVLSFAVASVKQDKDNPPPKFNIPLGPGNPDASTGGIFSATNLPVVIYIMFAYDLTGNQMQFVLPGLPGWANTDRFDIEARSDDPNLTKKQMRLMMQSLLADRFKLVVHRETRQVPALGLALSKPGKFGAWLQPHSTNVPCSAAPSNTPFDPSSRSASSGGFPSSCGVIASMPTTGQGRYAFGARDVSMLFIANILGAMPELGRPVVDQTGLSGTFDFKLEFTPQANNATPANPVQTDAGGTTFLEAVKEQLGLKFLPQQSAVEVVIVDHVERPSAN